ncbi:MAG: beta-1,6-N-acetylglucosaminyltransferase [Candidatus Gracilibacteria bacterium]|nr:beta-1,6-N-acetylglucosaminyltransferase [Candidatus Gracilibacteria bacterium]
MIKKLHVNEIENLNDNNQINIAYLVLVHRLPKQFKRLFKAIYSPNNYYLIHIDKKADKDLHEEIKEFINDFQNTYILESENIVWGGYSMVQVELNGIKKLLEISDKWDYFINLSGQDYPLKSQKEITNYLSKNLNNNFLKVADQLIERPETMNRIDNYFVDNGTNMSEIKSKKREFLDNVTPYIGGQWMILTRKCCEFIINDLETKKFEKFYINTLIADESFFQTLLMNSSFTGKIINDDKRSIIWVADGDIKLRPKTFDNTDIDYLSINDNLFARKFDDNIDSEIINKIKLNFNLPINDK